MFITREMDYAVRILRALRSGEQLTSAQIAAREHMAPAITYKMMKPLTRAGIIESRRGHVGGYALARHAGELTLYDLFSALGGQLFITQCLEPGYDCANNVCGACGVHREFARIQQRLEEELKCKTLEELFSSCAAIIPPEAKST